MKNTNIKASISYECQFGGKGVTSTLKTKNDVEKTRDNSENDSSNIIQHSYGPILPEYLRNSRKEFDDDEPQANSVCDSSLSDPVENKKILGPEIPNHLSSTIDSEQEANSDTDEPYGPSTSLMVQSSDEISSTSSKSFISLRKGSNAPTVKRESWMLELPSRTAAFGMGPRQFQSKLSVEKSDDCSGWTETPADKARKQNQIDSKNDKDVMRLKQLKERDRMLEKLIKKAWKKKKREKSLLEIHKKKIKKKLKKEATKKEHEKKPVERRPFDRNVDLQVNRFDLAQKKSIINKAQLLNDRFQQGESKFL